MKSGAHRCALLRHPRQVGGRVLYAGDVLQFEQPRHGLDRHVDHRTGGNVVDDDRNPDRVVDRLEVLVHAFLGRLVVVRRHHQHGVGACLLRMLGEFDRFAGRVGARARDDGHAALGLVDAPFDDALVFVMAERRAFAGRADRDQTVVPSICQLTSPRKAASSSEPFLNGVTKAVNDPRNFVLAAMDFLQTLKIRRYRNWISIHIGSGDQAKGPCCMALALCFNAFSRLGPYRPGSKCL